MEKMDLGVSLSGSSSATSGISGGATFGDLIAGGSKASPWALLGVLAAVLVLGVVWLVTR